MNKNTTQKIFAANWKLNKNPTQTIAFLTEIKTLLSKSQNARFVFFPPATNLEAAMSAVQGSPILIGAQNCYSDLKGAFTGETSAETVRDLGCQWVLIGHSERRKIFLEKDEFIAKKLQVVQDLGMVPLLCIGETLEDRENNRTTLILEAQLQIGLQGADRKKTLCIAYEPVWAIGTGKVATSKQVEEAHEYIRRRITDMGFSLDTPILYGGSVKGDNAKELVSIKNVDGFLIGGASLEIKSFLEIVNAN